MKYRDFFCAIFITLLFLGIIFIGINNQQPSWPTNNSTKKVVVLGFDGIEHTLLEKWMAEGKLPNFKRLSETGDYSTLETTIPAQSPVAWSTFSTGTNPGKHNVMDFIVRDPRTYTPSIGMIDVQNNRFGKPTITSKQKGETFWEVLSQMGLRSKIIKVPITFPPKPLNGELLTGLGTPDALGTIGTFQFFTTEKTSYIDNDQAYTLINLENKEVVKTKIKGPKNISKSLRIKRNESSVVLTMDGKDYNLENGKWTDYIYIDFNLLGPIYQDKGIARFYLEETQPELKLYLSPISFNPEKPLYDISYPNSFSKNLSEEIGLFKTLGFSVDLWALKEERINEDVFLEDLNNSLEEEKKILRSQLGKSDWNTYIQVFQATDLVQHMFFRFLDEKHPRYEANSKYQNSILETYQKMDQIIGETQEIVPNDTTLFVMSDHGFKTYRKSVDLNSWLYENGYLSLKDPSKRGDFLNNVSDPNNFWDNIDWSKTKAYGLGLGSLYINLQGREESGIVSEEEYTALRKDIQTKLLALDDNGTKVIANIYKKEEVMHGPYLYDAADLIVGFNEGYRVSWQTTFGTVPKKTIFDNNNKFSGDHCSVDPPLIPGVILSNKELPDGRLSLADLAPIILNEFGIEKPFNMDSTLNFK